VNPPLQRAPARALTATLCVQTLTAFSQQTPVVLAAILAAMLAVGEESIGFFTGLVYLTALSSGLFLSVYINRFGAIRFSQLAMLACALGLFAVAMTSLPSLVVGALLLGVGYGLANPTAAVILGRHAPPLRRGVFFSLKQTGVPLGIALAGVSVPLLLTVFGPQGVCFVVAGICLLCAVGLQPMVQVFDREQLATAARQSVERNWTDPIRMVFKSGPLRRLGFVSFVYAATQVCFLTFLVVYLSVERGMTLALAASTLAIGQVSSVIGRPLWGWLADRTGQPAPILGVLGLGMGLSCLLLAWLPAQPDLYTAYAVSLFCGLTAVAWNGVFYAELVRQSDASQLAEITGGVQALTFGGAMVGPVAFGVAVSMLGSYQPAYIGLAVLPALAGLAVLIGGHRARN
jgi:MFS family permease